MKALGQGDLAPSRPRSIVQTFLFLIGSLTVATLKKHHPSDALTDLETRIQNQDVAGPCSLWVLQEKVPPASPRPQGLQASELLASSLPNLTILTWAFFCGSLCPSLLITGGFMTQPNAGWSHLKILN